MAAKSWFCELAIFGVMWRSGWEPWVGTHASRGNGQRGAAFLSIGCQVPDAKANSIPAVEGSWAALCSSPGPGCPIVGQAPGCPNALLYSSVGHNREVPVKW